MKIRRKRNAFGEKIEGTSNPDEIVTKHDFAPSRTRRENIRRVAGLAVAGVVTLGVGLAANQALKNDSPKSLKRAEQSSGTISAPCLTAPGTEDIPSTAFWAATSRVGLQLIDPNSELAQTIQAQIDRMSEDEKMKDDSMSLGDILVATESSFMINPEDIGIDPQAIASCGHHPDAITED